MLMEEAVHTQYGPAGAARSRPHGDAQTLLPCLWQGFKKDLVKGARGPTSLPAGGWGPRVVGVKEAACSWSSWACWRTPSSGEGARDKSCARPQDQNQTGETGLCLEVNGEQRGIWLETGSQEMEEKTEGREGGSCQCHWQPVPNAGVCGGAGRSPWPKESMKGGDETGTGCARRHSRNQCACEGERTLTRVWERAGICWARRTE